MNMPTAKTNTRGVLPTCQVTWVLLFFGFVERDLLNTEHYNGNFHIQRGATSFFCFQDAVSGNLLY